MKMLWCCVFMVFLSVPFVAQEVWMQVTEAQQEIPELMRPVTDLTGTLSETEITQLEESLYRFQQTKGPQVAVLLVPTTQPEALEAFALKVAEKSKIGRVKIDDWVLLLIAKNDRKIRIENGYGVEGVLTDALASQIIRQVITPKFKEGDFAGGVREGVDSILRILSNEEFVPPEQRSASRREKKGGLSIGIIGGVLLGAWLSLFLGRAIGGIIGGGASFLFAFAALPFALALIIGVLVALFLLIGGGNAVLAGGGGFGGGGFGGGGGSYGGGSGRGGGGGASGSW